MNNEYGALFTPFNIGNLHIKNRFVMCPMTGSSLIQKNEFNYDVEEFYLKRAQNGVGLIITAPSMVLDMWGRGYWLSEAEEAFAGPFKTFIEKIHKYDTKIILQLGVGLGRVIHMEPAAIIEGANIEKIRTAASDLPNVWEPEVKHRALTLDEIITLRDNTIQSAVMAKAAGVDGVEIHAVHEGYLLDQFAIEKFNKRTDQYGGSLENRMRLACEIVSGIKKACGNDFVVTVRFSVISKMKGLNKGALPDEDYVEYGRTAEESQVVAKMLEKAGCDALNADNGTYDSWYWAHPPMYMGRACNLNDAAYIKKYVNIPVICAGRMEDHRQSAKAIEEGLIDGVGIARQLLADAELVAKLQAGKPEDIRPCIACHNGCLGSLLEGRGLSCALDPSVLHEDEYRITPTEKCKRIMIIGGGIGGMEAARICALKGHDVTIYEKTNKLAGVFNAAAAPEFKEADKGLIEWYKKQIEKLAIKVIFETTVTKKLIDEVKPDALIAATGATPRILSFDGLPESEIVSAIDYLLGKKEVGEKLIVVGGGLTGCEIAYDAAKKGHKVTVVEIADRILTAKLLCAANSIMLKDLMAYYNVDIMTSTNIKNVSGKTVTLENGGNAITIEADNIIVSVGYTPNEDIYKSMKDEYESYIIGDANKVGSLLDVIKGAYKVALVV